MGDTTRTFDSIIQQYLALGDSYTIGEGVDKKDRATQISWVKHWLRSWNLTINQQVIIAKLDVDIDELEKELKALRISHLLRSSGPYWLAVNKSVIRGKAVRGIQNWICSKCYFRAIGLLETFQMHVIVLSIPDCGNYPFRSGKRRGPIKI